MMEKPAIAIHSGLTDTEPGEVGYDAARLVQLDTLFEDLIVRKKLQCASYLLSRNGRIFAGKSMGRLTHHEDSPEFMPDSIRRIASITKLFASIAVMKLVEDGKLSLDQSVSTILEEFNTDMHRKITVWHLLTHTAGLFADPGYFTEPYTRGWWEGLEEKAQRGEKPNWIKAILSGPLLSKPGEKWNYSTAGFMILGEIVSRLSGMSCEDYILETVCKPLGMNNTFFDVPEALHSRVCVTNEWSEKSLKSKEDRTGKPPRTGGGLYSTLYDLNTLGQMLLNKGTYKGVRILGRKTVEAMTANQLTGIPAFHWGGNIQEMKMGLGVSLATSDLMTPGTFGHEGAGRSALAIDPAEGFVAAFFVPTDVDWVPESLINAKAVIWSGIL